LWVGPYNGELLFVPSKFEAEDGGHLLNVPIGNVTLMRIMNIHPGQYRVHYLRDGQLNAIEYQGMYAALTALSQI
jgi:hypothetical protein